MSNPESVRQGWTSASNAEADALCLARHFAQRGLPEVERPDSTFGNQIHAALAVAKPDGLSLEQTEIYDACQKIAAKLALQFFGNEALQAKTYRHRRFWLKLTSQGGKGLFQHSGEADVVYHLGSRLLILDYKCLPGEKTESSRNGQLRDLAVLAAGEIPETQEVAVAIVQPLVTHSPELCLYKPDDLKRSALDLYGRIVKSNDPKSSRVAGSIQCAFCLAKSNCREYQAWATRMVPSPRSILDVPVAQWTGEQCALFLDNAGIAQKWIDDCYEAMKARVKADPNSVPGWALKPGTVKHPINDPQACFDRFAALGGKIEQFLKIVSIGKGDLKEAIHTVTGAKGQALDKAIVALTQGIVDDKPDAPSLVKKG